MTRKVWIKNDRGMKIAALIGSPKKGKAPYPTVVICHGFKGYKEQQHLKSLAGELEKNGFMTVRFDFTNEVGESDGNIENIKLSNELKDLRSVIDYISKQKNVDPSRIGIAGHSLGGKLVLDYAPSDKRVKAIVDMAGVVLRGGEGTRLQRNIKEQQAKIKEKGFFTVTSKSKHKIYKIKIGFYLDLVKFNTLLSITKIKVPTLIVHGSEDESVPVKQSQIAFQNIKAPKKMVIIKGAPHTWKKPADYRRVNPIILDWFAKYL